MKKHFVSGEYWYCNVALDRSKTFIRENTKPMKVWAIIKNNNSSIRLYKKPIFTEENQITIQVSGGYPEYSLDYDYFGHFNECVTWRGYLRDTYEESLSLYKSRIDYCINQVEDVLSRFPVAITNKVNTLYGCGSWVDRLPKPSSLEKLPIDNGKTWVYFAHYLDDPKRGINRHFKPSSLADRPIKTLLFANNKIVFIKSGPNTWNQEYRIASREDGKKTINYNYLDKDNYDSWKSYIFNNSNDAINSYYLQYMKGMERTRNLYVDLRESLEGLKF